MEIFAKIRAFFYSIWFLVSVFIVVILMALFRSKNRTIRRYWAKTQKFFLGYKLAQNGKFKNEAQILLINHKSILDIIILEETHPSDLAWVAKKEIGKIPIIGKILSIPKMIPIDRSNPRSIVKLVKDVEDRVKDKRVIAIFPEGTRSRGDRMLKFHTGAKVIVQKLGLKVQPIVLCDTLQILDSKKFTQKSGIVSLSCLDIVDTTEPDWFKKTKEKMQEVYDAELKKLKEGFYK